MNLSIGALDSRKKGDYKNNLLAANQDYLILDALFTQPDNSTVNIDFDVLDDTLLTYFVSNGTTSNYLAHTSSKAFFVQAGGVSDGVLSGQVDNGRHTLTIRRGVNQNFFSLDGGAEQLSTVTAAIEILEFKVSTFYRNQCIYNFTLDNEVYGLNEANGATFTGSLGSTGTRVTNHADGLDYINNVMIQRYA